MLVLLCVISCGFAVQAESYEHNAPAFIEEVAQGNLASFENRSVNWDSNDNYCKRIQDTAFQDHNPLPLARRRAAFNLIKLVAEREPYAVSRILDDQATWEDLALLAGKPKEVTKSGFKYIDRSQCFVNVIDRSTLEIGKAMLATMVAQPTDDLIELNRRQEIIRTLLNNQKLADDLNGELKKVAQSENLFLSLYGHDLMKELVDTRRAKAPSKFFNNSWGWLEAKERGEWSIKVVKATGRIAIMSLASAWLLAKIYQNRGSAQNYVKSFIAGNPAVNGQGAQDLPTSVLESHFLNVVRTTQPDQLLSPDGRMSEVFRNAVQPLIDRAQHDSTMNPVQRILPGFDATMTAAIGTDLSLNIFNAAYGLVYKLIKSVVPPATDPFKLCLAACSLVFLTYHCENKIDKVKAHTLLNKLLHYKVRSIAQVIRSGRSMWSLLKGNRFLSVNLPAVNTLRTFYGTTIHENAHLKEFCSLLESDSFKGNYSFFKSQGKIIRAYFLLESCKEQLASLYVALGQIDVYCGMSKLVHEFEDKPVRFSFAQFDSGTTPFLSLRRFWNPFVSPNKVVPNSLVLGRDQNSNNIIMTGPNAGGKSTVMRSIIFNIILAQVFGIAAADAFIMTPYSLINTYFKVTDDIATGGSLFKEQIARADSLAKRVSALPSNKKAITAADELYNGTSKLQAAACGAAFAEHFGAFANSNLLLATHYEELTQLAGDGRFVNYCVEAEYDENGVPQPTYWLKPGISTQEIAIDMLRKEGYSGSMVDTAQAYLNKYRAAAGGKNNRTAVNRKPPQREGDPQVVVESK